MGVGGSSLLARSWARTLRLGPGYGYGSSSRSGPRSGPRSGSPAKAAGQGQGQGQGPDHPDDYEGRLQRAGGLGGPLRRTGISNAPDVIEAHERYGRNAAESPQTPSPRPRPRPHLHLQSLQPRPSPAPAPAPEGTPTPVRYTYSLYPTTPPQRLVTTPHDRKLPTQHQHPVDLMLVGAVSTPSMVVLDSSAAVVAGAEAEQRSGSRPHSQKSEKRARATCTRGGTPTKAPSRPVSRSSRRSYPRHRDRAHQPHRTTRQPQPRPRAPRPHELRTRTSRTEAPKDRSSFGYDIQDVDGFLAKASLESPANIPMVLASASVLYRTWEGGWQEEVALPLGMVVNGVFRASRWLYAQTPHGDEGYVRYSACLPLGILPPPVNQGRAAKAPPCWDTASDVFPAPSGNRTDNDKLRDTRSERGYNLQRSGPAAGRRARSKSGTLESLHSQRAELRVDTLYLRASSASRITSTTSERRPLVIVQKDFQGRPGLSVEQGDVLAVLGSPSAGWLRVRDRHGREGAIPAVVAGNGFI